MRIENCTQERIANMFKKFDILDINFNTENNITKAKEYIKKYRNPIDPKQIFDFITEKNLDFYVWIFNGNEIDDVDSWGVDITRFAIKLIQSGNSEWLTFRIRQPTIEKTCLTLKAILKSNLSKKIMNDCGWKRYIRAIFDRSDDHKDFIIEKMDIEDLLRIQI